MTALSQVIAGRRGPAIQTSGKTTFNVVSLRSTKEWSGLLEPRGREPRGTTRGPGLTPEDDRGE